MPEVIWKFLCVELHKVRPTVKPKKTFKRSTFKPKRTSKSHLKQIGNNKINKETPQPWNIPQDTPKQVCKCYCTYVWTLCLSRFDSLCVCLVISNLLMMRLDLAQWWKNHRHGPPGLPYGPSWCLLKALLRFAQASKFWFVNRNQKRLLLRRCHIAVKSSWIYPSIVLRVFSKICTAPQWELRNEPGESHWKLLETQKRGSRRGAVHIYEKPS